MEWSACALFAGQGNIQIAIKAKADIAIIIAISGHSKREPNSRSITSFFALGL